jgi:hypothetical protein
VLTLNNQNSIVNEIMRMTIYSNAANQITYVSSLSFDAFNESLIEHGWVILSSARLHWNNWYSNSINSRL